MTLKMAVPNKGRLNERAVELLTKSGLDLGESWGRKLYVAVKNKDIEIIFVRAQDIPVFVHSGAVDIGITGQDQIANADVDVEEIKKLEFGHCRLSVAVPEASGIKSVSDIPDGSRVATSFGTVAKKFFDSHGKKVDIIPVTGAAEIMPYMGVSDFIVDLVSSGSTLKTNRLIEIQTILESQAVIIANRDSLSRNQNDISNIVNAIGSVMNAEQKKYLMAVIPVEKIEEVQKMFPGLAGPTIMNIAGHPDKVAIHVVIGKNEIYDAVNDIKKLGGEGVLTLNIDGLVD
ncbi:MAG: ATP phosphoribosyltransferase [Candidatus Methanomethylophilaceae archaeon]|nr:ATP phosphoribosyltransferase [Candidatus Methanomethylophilaceae archaeon]